MKMHLSNLASRIEALETKVWLYSKICVKRPLSKIQKIGFQDQLSLKAGQKCCRMLQGEHSAILSTFIKLPFDIKTFVTSIFEWPFYTSFTVILPWKRVYLHPRSDWRSLQT